MDLVTHVARRALYWELSYYLLLEGEGIGELPSFGYWADQLARVELNSVAIQGEDETLSEFCSRIQRGLASMLNISR